MLCFFASDLHGHPSRYAALLAAMERDRPAVVLLGGDLLPGFAGLGQSDPELSDFFGTYLRRRLVALRQRLASAYPRILTILGNDDPRTELPELEALANDGLLEHVHMRRVLLPDGTALYGYACVPPTPFALKDWERYDVSRYVDPGCIAPDEGRHSVKVDSTIVSWRTIAEDLDELFAGIDASELQRSLLLCHTPPYRTALDRAALDGKQVDHAPLDVNIGSIALRRFIETRKPRLTLHGHVHEAARLSGRWRDQLGRTELFGAAHDGPELALVRFDLRNLSSARRELLV